MKKIAVILCVLLSLFVFVSCPEPDNAPKVPDAGTGGGAGGKPTSEEFEFIVSMDIFDESVRPDIKKIEVLYEVEVEYRAVANTKVFDVPADGKVSVGKIKVKKGECISYCITALDKDSKELEVKIGELVPDGKSSTIILDATKVIPSKVTLMVENPTYESKIAHYKWKLDSDVYYKTAAKGAGQYTTLGVVDVPVGMDALRVSLTILDAEKKDIGQKNSLLILTPETKEYVVDLPVEKITRTIEVEKGTYLDPVGGYALFLNSQLKGYSYASSTGNTVLLNSDSITDGDRYTIRALKAVNDQKEPYDKTKVIGESSGTINIDPKSSKIILKAPEPYGCYDLSCLPTFSTKNVFWTIAQQDVDGTWTEKGGVEHYYPNHPEENRYYLPEGTYKITKNSINEFPGQSTSWKNKSLDDHEFKIVANQKTVIAMEFDDYERIDVKVTAKYPSDDLTGWKYRIYMDFGSKTYLSVNNYTYDIDIFSSDPATKTITFSCYGIPKDTVNLKISVTKDNTEKDSVNYGNVELQTGELNWNNYSFK